MIVGVSLAAALALAGAGLSLGGDDDGSGQAAAGRPNDLVLTPEVVDREQVRAATRRDRDSQPARVALRDAASREKPTATRRDRGSAISPGAPSDAEVRAELSAARAALSRFKQYLGTTAYLQTGPRARVLPDGTAVAPDDAPEPVKRVIQAANAIASLPYKWGGGHGAWRDDGYDCSGSVSFALAGAGLLDSPLASGGFADWGARGPGEWITIYTNPGHMFMVVAGLRFDTSGRGRAGTRWQEGVRTTGGYVVRHQPGL
ncbi:MAG: hypothetical protein ACR2GL_07570 [Thermoleophilaceae bacterium]